MAKSEKWLKSRRCRLERRTMAEEETAPLLDLRNQDEAEDKCGSLLAFAAIAFSMTTLLFILASSIRLASASVLLSLFAAVLWWARFVWRERKSNKEEELPSFFSFQTS